MKSDWTLPRINHWAKDVDRSEPLIIQNPSDGHAMTETTDCGALTNNRKSVRRLFQQSTSNNVSILIEKLKFFVHPNILQAIRDLVFYDQGISLSLQKPNLTQPFINTNAFLCLPAILKLNS